MSSGTAEATEAALGESLLARFENIGVVFDDLVVAKPTGEVFHRVDSDAGEHRPACEAGSHDDPQVVTPEVAHREGFHPCRRCYEPIFEYLADQPDSPVEARHPPVDIEEIASEDVEAFDPVRPRPKPDPLLTLTDEVMVTSGSKVMHVPQSKGPLCDRSGDYRCVERTAVDGHYRPCKNCFAVNDV